jgi:cellulose synthase/poly-beta-1,6-N-acetylglucosamine synthase-like glycosyltransferase
MTIIEVLAYFLGLLYALQTILLLRGWRKKIKIQESKTSSALRFSILVAFRNEEKNLGMLCSNLNALNYPRELFEIILVNDHSEDAGEAVIRNILEADIHYSILNLHHNKGKKKALELGIQSAKFDWIVCTDADCHIPNQWLQLFSQAQASSNKVMWCGRVYFSEKSNWDKLLAHEFSSIIGVGGATIQSGIPTMCNGANLAYLKKAYQEVGGYSDNERIASGDDEFLMHKLYKKYPNGIGFLNHPQHTVFTQAPQTLHAFIQQRLRWASKWQHYQHPFSRYFAVFTLILQSSLLIMPVLSLSGLLSWHSTGLVWVLKLLSDSVFIHTIRKDFERSLNLFILLCLEVVYPGYVLFIGVISRFSAYEWKERKIK